MLRTARRIPRRFSRRVSPLTQSVVRRRHERSKSYALERLKRFAQRVQRRIVIDRKTVISIVVALVVSLVALGVGIVLFSPLVTVHEVRVQRTDPRIDFEQVQNALAPVYGRALFFLSAAEVEQLLHDAIPDLEAVDVTKDYPRSILVRLRFDPLVARLQIRDPDGVVINHLGSGAGLGGDYLTTRGMYVVYPDSAVESGNLLPALDVVDWGVRPSPWTNLVEPETLTTIRKAEVALADQFGLNVTRRTVYLRAREFHLTAGRRTLWFDRRSPLADQLERLGMFLETIGWDKVKDYVDLRIKDKVVYQ